MKILMIATEAHSLINFRFSLIKEFIKHENVVIVAAPDISQKDKKIFSQNDIKYFDVNIRRNSKNPFHDIITFFAIKKVIKQVKPDCVFSYFAKAVVYGSIAAKLSKVKNIYSLIAGLGTVYRETDSIIEKIHKFLLILLYKISSKCCKTVFLQNNDDKKEVIKSKIAKPDKLVVVPGSGVDTAKFFKTPLPKENSFLFAGRLIRGKGLIEFCEAAKIVKNMYPDAIFNVIGAYDTNPHALKEDELKKYFETIISYHGYVDTKEYIDKSRFFVSPSYHEGRGMAVLEAMSSGRMVIGADTSGINESINDGVDGLLVPIKNIEILAEKMIWCIKNPDEVEKMAEKAHEKVLNEFSCEKINKIFINTMGLKQYNDNALK